MRQVGKATGYAVERTIDWVGWVWVDWVWAWVWVWVDWVVGVDWCVHVETREVVLLLCGEDAQNEMYPGAVQSGGFRSGRRGFRRRDVTEVPGSGERGRR